jgi:hypothetical protein
LRATPETRLSIRDIILTSGRVPFEVRFWSKVDKSGSCWLWTAQTNDHGYGLFPVINSALKYRKTLSTHRVSWIAHNGDIPPGMHVLHKCDTPACVNPEHLFLGTHADNVADSISKGRHSNPPYARGSRTTSAKLKEADVLHIRALRDGGATQRAIGLLYGVTRSAIGSIVNRRRWSWM